MMKPSYGRAICVITLAWMVGCFKQENPPKPERPDDMRKSDLEITASIEQASASESHFFQFKLRNHLDSQSLAPMIPSMPATLTLRNEATGQETVKVWNPTPRPGLPRLGSDPEAHLEPGQVWITGLPLRDYLGVLPVGQYSVKFRLASTKYPFESAWMDFQISVPNPGTSSARNHDVKANQGPALRSP